MLVGVGWGKGHLLIRYYPIFFFFLFSFFSYTEYSILVWEAIDNSTLVLKIDFHVPIVLASEQVQILIWIYSKILFAFKTQIVYSSDFTMKMLNKKLNKGKKLNKIIHVFCVKIDGSWFSLSVLTTRKDLSQGLFYGVDFKGRLGTSRNSYPARQYWTYRIGGCNANNAILCQVFRHICQVISLVTASTRPEGLVLRLLLILRPLESGPARAEGDSASMWYSTGHVCQAGHLRLGTLGPSSWSR